MVGELPRHRVRGCIGGDGGGGELGVGHPAAAMHVGGTSLCLAPSSLLVARSGAARARAGLLYGSRVEPRVGERAVPRTASRFPARDIARAVPCAPTRCDKCLAHFPVHAPG